jgi:hypothetical protein
MISLFVLLWMGAGQHCGRHRGARGLDRRIMNVHERSGHLIDQLFEVGCKHLRERDTSEAAQCFRLAAEQGHTNAKNMPGVVLINTNGNFDAAYKPICEAADKGNDAAIGNLPCGDTRLGRQLKRQND